MHFRNVYVHLWNTNYPYVYIQENNENHLNCNLLPIRHNVPQVWPIDKCVYLQEAMSHVLCVMTDKNQYYSM